MKPTKEIEKFFQPNVAVIERWLSEYGYGSSQEREVGCWCCDLYLDKYSVDIEVDGPWHYLKKDKKRDKDLLERFGVHVFRIKDEDVFEINKEKIMEKFEKWLRLKN